MPSAATSTRDTSVAHARASRWPSPVHAVPMTSTPAMWFRRLLDVRPRAFLPLLCVGLLLLVAAPAELLGMENSLAERRELATELGYTGDMSDTATMGIWLHKQVMKQMATNGGKVPAHMLD